MSVSMDEDVSVDDSDGCQWMSVHVGKCGSG